MRSPFRREYTIPANHAVQIPDQWLFVSTASEADQVARDRTIYHFKSASWIYWRVDREQGGGVTGNFHIDVLDAFWDVVDSTIEDGHTLHMVLPDVPFHFQVLAGFRELARRKWRLAHIYTRDKVTIMRFRKEGKGLVILDIRNWCSDWAAAFDGVINQERHMFQYVRDLIAQLREHDLGSMRYTAASLSWSVWRHKFYKTPITVHHLESAVALERAAYVGGYCQPMKLYAPESEQIYKLDVNSMYPFVMQQNLYPVRLHSLLPSMEPAELLEALDKYCAIARVEVETDENIYPYRHEGRVYYPIGRFETVAASRALERLLERDQVRAVHGVALYESGDPFSDFVDYWYDRKVEARRAGNASEEMLCKLVLNSLYGKFGQKGTDQKVVGTAPEGEFSCMLNWVPETGECWTEFVGGGSVIELRESGETLTSFPAVAAHVTEYARLWLWHLIRIAGRHTVYYCDTDSLFTNQRGFTLLTSLRSAHIIGALKHEGGGQGVRVYAKKDYRIGDTRVLKGVSAPDLIRPDGTFDETWHLSIMSAAEIKQIEGAHTLSIRRLYNPWVSGCRVERDTRVLPLELPRDHALLQRRIYTLPIHERVK